MTLFIYYSISSDLTQGEIIEIDRQVAQNREKVFFFVKNLASNAKNKTKKIIIVIIVGGIVYLTNVPPSEAIGLNIKPAIMVRVHQPDSKVQIAKVIPRKKDLIEKKYLFIYLCILTCIIRVKPVR